MPLSVSQSGYNKAAVLNDELPPVICSFKLSVQLHDPDPEVDLPDMPDACSRPDLTLPPPPTPNITPFIGSDLSPLPVKEEALTSCNSEKKSWGGGGLSRKNGASR